MGYRYQAAQVPNFLYKAVHGVDPMRLDKDRRVGGRSYNDPSARGEELAERLDMEHAWRRLPNTKIKRMYWDIVIHEMPFWEAANKYHLSVRDVQATFHAGSDWLAKLLNDKDLC